MHLQGDRGLRRLRALALDRRGDDGHALRAGPADARPLPGRARLPLPDLGWEIVTVSRLVNAFFRWEFNSCETIVKDGEGAPIDYANASPDVAITSLHYYFPWAMRALVRWTAFAVVTGRQMRIDLDPREYFAIGDRDDLSYDEKLRVPPARRRVLRDRALRGVRRGVARAARRAHGRLLREPGVRRPARADRPLDVPGARAGALRRALPRARRRVGRGPGPH